LEVLVSQPVKDKIRDWDTHTGTMEAQKKVDVRCRVRGHITKIEFTEGQEIKKDAELFVIDSRPFQADLKQAQGAKKAWQSKLKLAQKKLEFYRPLAAKETVSREELLQAEAAESEAEGAIETAEGKIEEATNNIKYCQIKAEIDGKVGQAYFKEGDL